MQNPSTLPLKKAAAAESNQELLGGAAPSGPDQRRRAARTGAKRRSPIDVCAPSSLPLAGNRIGGDGGSRRSSRRSGSLRVRTKRLSGKRSKCPGATWGRHESDAAARRQQQREFTPSPPARPPRNKGKLKKKTPAFPRPAANAPEAQRSDLSSEEGGTQHARARRSRCHGSLSLFSPLAISGTCTGKI